MARVPPDAPLIVVDSHDVVVGALDKQSCHDGEGVLHRAFSVLVFDAAGCLLVQRRADGKRLFAGLWSNSVCSHPRLGEAIDDAARRRLREEIDVVADVEPIYRFEYRARDGDRGVEHEMCTVFLSRLPAGATPKSDPDEIAETRWLDAATLDTEMAAQPQWFTPWFKLEWTTLRAHHAAALARYDVV